MKYRVAMVIIDNKNDDGCRIVTRIDPPAPPDGTPHNSAAIAMAVYLGEMAKQVNGKAKGARRARAPKR